MGKTRKPVQSRSIEKMEKISQAGFALFCEKGFHKTNTIEIAQRAGVSTGALYSYFQNKRQIFIAAFEQYLNAISKQLFEKLEDLQQPFSLSDFIERWISFYVDLYASSSHALVKLRMMMLQDEEINHHFCNFENEYFSKIIEILNQNGIHSDNLLEKVYTSCILVDALNIEKSTFPHDDLNYKALKSLMTKTIYDFLSD